MICAMSSGVLLCACAPPQPSVDLAAEQAGLRAAADAYHEAAQTLDIDNLVDFYANDGLILPPNAAKEKGLQGVRSFADAFTQTPGFAIRFEDMTVEVAASGDMGYTLADAVISVEGPDGGPVQDRIRDFHLWKKQDGEWKLAIDIWNSELPVPGVEDTSEADREAIGAVTQQVREAYMARDWDRFSGLFTEDAIWMPGNRLPLTGKAAWWSFVEQSWDRTTVEEMDLVSEELVLAGDWAFERHTETTVTAVTAGEGEPSTSRSKGVWLFHREVDGSWKIARYIWNPNPAPN